MDKAEIDYKNKITEINKCMNKLERFKNHSLNEIQNLVDDASSEVRRLTINYINKFYPNQKLKLIHELLDIVPETDFRRFVENLHLPNLPQYTFTKYDEIRC